MVCIKEVRSTEGTGGRLGNDNDCPMTAPVPAGNRVGAESPSTSKRWTIYLIESSQLGDQLGKKKACNGPRLRPIAGHKARWRVGTVTATDV